MKKFNTLLTYVSSNRILQIFLLCQTKVFIYMIMLKMPEKYQRC